MRIIFLTLAEFKIFLKMQEIMRAEHNTVGHVFWWKWRHFDVSKKKNHSCGEAGPLADKK